MRFGYFVLFACICLAGCDTGDTYYIDKANDPITATTEKKHVHPVNALKLKNYDLASLVGTWLMYTKSEGILKSTDEVVYTSITIQY